jgi:hypothetical protein
MPGVRLDHRQTVRFWVGKTSCNNGQKGIPFGTLPRRSKHQRHRYPFLPASKILNDLFVEPQPNPPIKATVISPRLKASSQLPSFHRARQNRRIDLHSYRLHQKPLVDLFLQLILSGKLFHKESPKSCFFSTFLPTQYFSPLLHCLVNRSNSSFTTITESEILCFL